MLASLAAGVCFAVAGVLQQWAAGGRPDAEALSPRLLAHLARDRVWLGGIALAVLAYGFQSPALAYGPLSLVQPLIVAELVFAVPLSARLHRMRLGFRADAGWAQRHPTPPGCRILTPPACSPSAETVRVAARRGGGPPSGHGPRWGGCRGPW